MLHRFRHQPDEESDAHMQAVAIARRGAEEGEHDGQEDGRRLRPGGRLVEDVAGIDAVGDDRRDEHHRDAGDHRAGDVEQVHRPAVKFSHRSSTKPSPDPALPRARGRGGRGGGRAYWTAWICLISSAYFAPYLSQTGLTASWKGFLSAMVSISIPAVFILSSASFSLISQSRRSSSCISWENLVTSAWSSFDSESQVFFEKTTISGTMRCSVRV